MKFSYYLYLNLLLSFGSFYNKVDCYQNHECENLIKVPHCLIRSFSCIITSLDKKLSPNDKAAYYELLTFIEKNHNIAPYHTIFFAINTSINILKCHKKKNKSLKKINKFFQIYLEILRANPANTACGCNGMCSCPIPCPCAEKALLKINKQIPF